jgi:hypothetical protein
MVAEPALTAVTRPAGETTATDALLVVQVMVPPGSSAPVLLRGTALSWYVSPMVSEKVFGLMVIDATASDGAVPPSPQEVMPATATAAELRTTRLRSVRTPRAERWVMTCGMIR